MFPTEEFCSCYWENPEFSYDWFIESIVYANWNRSCKVFVLKDYSDNWCLLNPLLKFFKSNEISFAGLSVICQNELACIYHPFENYESCLWGWMIWSFHLGVTWPGWVTKRGFNLFSFTFYPCYGKSKGCINLLRYWKIVPGWIRTSMLPWVFTILS